MLRGLGVTILMLLKRTPMIRICTAPFYAEVPWRGRPGAELCGLTFNPLVEGAGGNWPLRGQDAANFIHILSPRRCQRRTIGRKSSAADRRRQQIL